MDKRKIALDNTGRAPRVLAYMPASHSVFYLGQDHLNGKLVLVDIDESRGTHVDAFQVYVGREGEELFPLDSLNQELVLDDGVPNGYMHRLVFRQHDLALEVLLERHGASAMIGFPRDKTSRRSLVPLLPYRRNNSSTNSSAHPDVSYLHRDM